MSSRQPSRSNVSNSACSWLDRESVRAFAESSSIRPWSPGENCNCSRARGSRGERTLEFNDPLPNGGIAGGGCFVAFHTPNSMPAAAPVPGLLGSKPIQNDLEFPKARPAWASLSLSPWLSFSSDGNQRQKTVACLIFFLRCIGKAVTIARMGCWDDSASERPRPSPNGLGNGAGAAGANCLSRPRRKGGLGIGPSLVGGLAF